MTTESKPVVSTSMPAQGDLDPESFRELAKGVVDLIADYLPDIERYAVLPRVAPGELAGRLDGPAPEVRRAVRGGHPRGLERESSSPT